MKITSLARQLDRKVQIHSDSFDDKWWAYIDKVGFPFGFVTVARSGNTPTEALEALVVALTGQELCVDGNTDHKRYVGPFALEA